MTAVWDICIRESNMLVWVYSLIQWNCMVRLISISPLGLHSLRYQDDHLIVSI